MRNFTLPQIPQRRDVSAPASHITPDPVPCAGCQHADTCRDLRLACRAFSVFLDGASRERWGQIERRPDRATFDRLLCGAPRIGRPRVRK